MAQLTLKHWIILLVSSLTVMAGATVAPALPQINIHFEDAWKADLLTRLIIVIPGLFIALFGPLVGYLLDRAGRIRVILGGVILYGLSGTIAYFLSDLISIVISRCFLGMAVAAVMTGATTLIGDYFDGEERKWFLGIQGSFMAAGGVLFITAGGVLADVSWRAPFLIYGLAFFLIPLVAFRLPEPKVESDSESKDTQSQSTVPVFWVGFNYAVVFLGMILFYMIPIQIPYLLKAMGPISNTQTGLAIATSTLFGAISSWNYRKVRQQLNFTQIFMLAFGLMMLGYTIISQAGSYEIILLAMVATGLGFGLTLPNVNLCLVTVAPPRLRGRIMGGSTTFIFLGQFFSPLVIQPFIDHFQSVQFVFLLAVGAMAFLQFVFFILLFGSRPKAFRI